MEKHVELQTFDGDVLRNRRDKDSISDVKAQEFDRDRYELARVGKEQVLKVCAGLHEGARRANTHSVVSAWYL